MEPAQHGKPRHRGGGPRANPWWTRSFHALNMLVLLVMAGSGLQIYNANPVFGGRGGTTVPPLFTLGGWLAGGRHWHFGFMGLYAMNLGLWIILLWRLRRKRLADSGDFSTINHSQNAPKRRYSIHRILYTIMLIVLSLSLLSGLAMYKPAQLWWLSGMFGSWQTLRVFHFATIPAMVVLVLAHALISWRIGGWRMIRSMFV